MYSSDCCHSKPHTLCKPLLICVVVAWYKMGTAKSIYALQVYIYRVGSSTRWRKIQEELNQDSLNYTNVHCFASKLGSLLIFYPYSPKQMVANFCLFSTNVMRKVWMYKKREQYLQGFPRSTRGIENSIYILKHSFRNASFIKLMASCKIHRCMGSSIIDFSFRVEQKHTLSKFLKPEHKKKVVLYMLISVLHIFLIPAHSETCFRILSHIKTYILLLILYLS